MPTEHIVGAALIAFAWLLDAATTVALIVWWPTVQTGEEASGTAFVGLLVAIIATWAIVKVFFGVDIIADAIHQIL